MGVPTDPADHKSCSLFKGIVTGLAQLGRGLLASEFCNSVFIVPPLTDVINQPASIPGILAS